MRKVRMCIFRNLYKSNMPNTRKNPWTKVAITLIVIGCCSHGSSYSQCISAGTNNPGTAVNAPYFGSNINFSNPTRVLSSNNSYASASALLTLLNGTTDYLNATNFGFSIPATAAVCGIEVQVEKSATQIGNILFLEAWVEDYIVKLVKGGTATGSNKASATHWTSTDSYITYGSSSDLWGTAWLPSDINAGNFGLAFAADVHGLVLGLASLLPSVRLDNILITVHYLPDAILPTGLQAFDVSPAKNNTAMISWKADLENSSTIYKLQRSPDGANWETINRNITETTNNNSAIYNTIDHEPYPGKSFYRLQLTSKTGTVSYSENRAFTAKAATGLKAYPNPFTSYVLVTGIEKDKDVLLYNEYGQRVPVPKRGTGKILQLQLTDLKKGIYFLLAGDKRIKIIKQ
jgi:hypothetical protein